MILDLDLVDPSGVRSSDLICTIGGWWPRIATWQPSWDGNCPWWYGGSIVRRV